jgi:hypothetical protein
VVAKNKGERARELLLVAARATVAEFLSRRRCFQVQAASMFVWCEQGDRPSHRTARWRNDWRMARSARATGSVSCEVEFR